MKKLYNYALLPERYWETKISLLPDKEYKKIIEGEEESVSMLKSMIFNPFLRFLTIIFVLSFSSFIAVTFGYK